MVSKSFELAGLTVASWELITDNEVRLAKHLLYHNHYFILIVMFFLTLAN